MMNEVAQFWVIVSQRKELQRGKEQLIREGYETLPIEVPNVSDSSMNQLTVAL